MVHQFSNQNLLIQNFLNSVSVELKKTRIIQIYENWVKEWQ